MCFLVGKLAATQIDLGDAHDLRRRDSNIIGTFLVVGIVITMLVVAVFVVTISFE